MVVSRLACQGLGLVGHANALSSAPSKPRAAIPRARLKSDRLRSESVADFDRKRWSGCVGARSAAVRGWDKLREAGIELESGEEVVHERERSQAFAAQLKRAGVWHDSFESASSQSLSLAIL